MKFVRLDLYAYGPFTNRALVFPEGGPNLHIVYGPNEAGKSTTLRAITGLLYGIEKQTGDAHLHPMNELRVGATLRHSSGAERTFVRRKGNQATLHDDKSKAVDESYLRAWLSIADRNHFEQMFGLGHEQLREAGEALSSAKTDVGRMLFGASLDGTTLHQTLLRLDAEADKLLSPGGSAGSIAKALIAYRDHGKRAKELTLPVKDWQTLQTEVDATQTKSGEQTAEVVHVRTQRHRLQRLQGALPWLRQRARAVDNLAAAGEVHLLPPDIDAQRRELSHALESAETSHRRVELDLARTQHDRDVLDIPEILLASGARIRQLNEDLGKYKGELRDRPGIVKEIVTLRGQQRELLREIGRPDLEPKELASIRVDEVSFERVRVLECQGIALRTRLDEVRSRLGQKRILTSQHEGALAALPLLADASVLRSTWEHLRPDKALSNTIGDVDARVAELDVSVTIACAALAPWNGTPDAALALPVPPEEVIRQFDTDFTENERVSKDLAAHLVARNRELNEILRELGELSTSGEPPSERQLLEARARRDRGWERVRRAWEMGLPPSATDDEFASEVPLVAAYAATVRVADELADEIRRESKRVAEYATLQRAEAAKRVERDGITREQTGAEASTLRRLEDWRQLWRHCGFDAATPREMLAWRGRYTALVDAIRRRDEVATQREALKRAVEDQQRELLGALSHAGAPIAEGTPWLTLLLHVERTLKLAQDRTGEHAALRKDLLNGQSDVASLEGQSAECDEKLSRWREDWGGAVAKFRLSANALPEEAKVVLERHAALFQLEDKCERQEVRLKAIEKQMKGFEEGVKALVAEFAPDLAGTPVELADALIERHGKVTMAAERRRTLEEQLAKHERDLDDARITLESERRRFDALLRDAGCADVGALEVAIERSTEARVQEGLRAEAEKRLAEVGEGWSLESLEHAAVETDSDRLEANIATLDERLKGLDAEQRSTAEVIGALRERQKKFSGADDAASVLADAHEHLALARSHAERYARLRLATALLRRGVESYRQKNEGTILQRASRLFERLTLGRYQKLCVQYDGDKAKLRCMRGHEAVEIENALSDGTLDQLYLSLRLASLEQHLESQEPMPLVLDDIFIHFDDERARAGLGVLAELAEKTQVLLLTHHARNLDLAKHSLKPGAWMEHRFAAPAGVGVEE